MTVLEFAQSEASWCYLDDLPQRGSVANQAFGTGWWELDNILKFYLGQFVVVSGIAGHGKSTFLLNVIAKLAIDRGIKSFLYVPENEGYLKQKIRSLWPGTDGQFEYFCASQCIVQTAIAKSADEPLHSVGWVLGRAEEAVQREKAELVLIDPWNELDRARERDESVTDYIGRSLMLVKDFCRTLNVIVIIVAHPTKAVLEKGGRIPNLGDIDGSMNWFNKCDNGFIVHRETGKNSAKVISGKVREIGAGKVGSCHFMVDPETGIFTPQYGASFDGPDKSEQGSFRNYGDR